MPTPGHDQPSIDCFKSSLLNTLLQDHPAKQSQPPPPSSSSATVAASDPTPQATRLLSHPPPPTDSSSCQPGSTAPPLPNALLSPKTSHPPPPDTLPRQPAQHPPLTSPPPPALPGPAPAPPAVAPPGASSNDFLSGSPSPVPPPSSISHQPILPLASTLTSPQLFADRAQSVLSPFSSNDTHPPNHPPSGLVSSLAPADQHSLARRNRLASDDPQLLIQPESNQPKPRHAAPDDPSLRKFLAMHFVDQLRSHPPPRSPESSPVRNGPTGPETISPAKPASSQPPSAQPSPHPAPSLCSEKISSPHNVGLRINSSIPPQELVISTSRVNQEILYTADPPPHVLPITLFPSNMAYAPGRRVAVDGFISYATKAGRIRVIDQNSGARMLLKKHEGPVVDMCIGKPRAIVADVGNPHTHTHSGSSSRRWRCVASAGSDGRLVIWKVPVRFEEDSAGYDILADVLAVDSNLLLGPEKNLSSLSNVRFQAIRWHPRDPSVFLVSTNDRRLILVRLDRGAFAAMWKRGMPLGRTLSELEAFEGQDVLRSNCDVMAFAFSPDGSAFAFVTRDNMLTVRQTCKPHWIIMGGQLPSSESPITRLDFLSTPHGLIKGFLLTKRSGTRVEVVQLSEISEVIIGITLQPPASTQADNLPCFGHVVWQTQYSTILVSNSVRGSIFAFHVNFCELPTEEENSLLRPMANIDNGRSAPQEDDASFIERVAASRQSSQMQRSRSNSWVASCTPFVDHISEVPSPDPIISFVLDEGLRPAPGPSSSNCSTFNLHPKGIHQLYLPKDVMIHPDDLNEERMSISLAPTRSLSLAGEILVDVKVEQEIAPVEVLEFGNDKPKRLLSPTTALPSSMGMAATNGQHRDREPHALSPDHLSLHPSNAHPQVDVVNVPLAAVSSASPPVTEAVLFRELNDSYQRLKQEFQDSLAKQGEKQNQRFSNELRKCREVDAVRHDNLMDLMMLSSSQNQKTIKVLEDTLRNEVGGPVSTALNKTLERSVQEHLKRGLSDGLKKQLGHEIEAALKKPETVAVFSNMVVPAFHHQMEETIERAIGNLAPMMMEVIQIQQTSTKSLAHEMSELSQELARLRAESRERNEVRELKANLNNMQQQITELQETLKQALAHRPSPSSDPIFHPHQLPALNGSVPTSGLHATTASYQSWGGSEQTSGNAHLSPHQPTSTHASGSASSQRATTHNSIGYREETSERLKTPTSAYEDMFLGALSDPSPRSLSKLIDEGSHDRLESIFSSKSPGAPSSVLSQPVVLTLAHRLSEEIHKPVGLPGMVEGHPDLERTLGAFGTNRLRWIWSCVGSVDFQDQQTSQYLDRVLDLCWQNLNSRKLRMVELNGLKEEIEGINEVLRLIQEKTKRGGGAGGNN